MKDFISNKYNTTRNIFKSFVGYVPRNSYYYHYYQKYLIYYFDYRVGFLPSVFSFAIISSAS